MLDKSRVRIPRSKMSKNPEYKGGETMLRYYLAKSIKYPRVASNYGLEGQTLVKFMVEADGTISNARVTENKITVDDKLPYQSSVATLASVFAKRRSTPLPRRLCASSTPCPSGIRASAMACPSKWNMSFPSISDCNITATMCGRAIHKEATCQ